MYCRIYFFVSPHRGRRAASRPEVVPNKVPAPLAEVARDMDRALPLDVPDHLRHRVLRWNRDQHMDMIGHQVTLFDLALLLPGQPTEDLPQVLPERPVQDLPAVLRNEDHMVFTLPFAVL